MLLVCCAADTACYVFFSHAVLTNKTSLTDSYGHEGGLIFRFLIKSGKLSEQNIVIDSKNIWVSASPTGLG